MKKIGEVSSFFGWRATLGLLNRCFGVSELNFRDAMCCLGGSDQVLQPDALGISLVSRPKRYEVGSLRVDMGNPGWYILFGSVVAHLAIAIKVLGIPFGT